MRFQNPQPLSSIRLRDHPHVCRRVITFRSCVQTILSRRDVSGLTRALQLFVVAFQYGVVDVLPVFEIDRMNDVGMQLGSTVAVMAYISPTLFASAMIAKARLQMVLGTATWTSVRHLAAGHRYENRAGTLNDFYVPYDEATIERNAGEGQQSIVRPDNELDFDFCYHHLARVLPSEPVVRLGVSNAMIGIRTNTSIVKNDD